MNNQEIAIVGLSTLVAWLCWVIRGAVLSSRNQSKEFALLQDTCNTWRETATRRAGELTEAWKQWQELCDALYLSESEAHQATHQQAVERAKRLVVGESARFECQRCPSLRSDLQRLKLAIRGGSDNPYPMEEVEPLAVVQREKAAELDEIRRAAMSCDLKRYSELLFPAMGVSGSVAEALIPTSDSIELETVFEKRDRFLGNQVEAALAHAEARSNGHG